MQTAVSGLEAEFPGKVQTHLRDATTPANAAACQGFGFQTHGLVIAAADGRVLWKQPDHGVNVDDARQQLRVLAGK